MWRKVERKWKGCRERRMNPRVTIYRLLFCFPKYAKAAVVAWQQTMIMINDASTGTALPTCLMRTRERSLTPCHWHDIYSYI